MANKRFEELPSEETVTSNHFVVTTKQNEDGTWKDSKILVSSIVANGSKKRIVVTVANLVGQSLSDDYFINNIIDEIVAERSTYLSGIDFDQNSGLITPKTFQFYNDTQNPQVIIAKI